MATKILLPIDHTDDRSWKNALPVALEQAKFYEAELHAVAVIPEIIQLPNLPPTTAQAPKTMCAMRFRPFWITAMPLTWRSTSKKAASTAKS